MHENAAAYTGHLAALFARVATGSLTVAVLRRVAGEGITPALLSVLECLRRRGACPVGDIARGLGVSYAAGSQFVHRLEAKGLVTRREDAHDRRRSRVSLTAAGLRLVQAVEEARANRLAAILEGMDPERRGDLVRGLEAFLLRALDDPEAIGQLCGRCHIEHFPDCVVNQAAIALTGHGVEG